MVIYGTALLAFCMLAGLVIGQLLGIALGVGKNVGGVGIAMLLLIVLSDWLRRRDRLPVPTQQGVLFWSSIYIPIVVAMAASAIFTGQHNLHGQQGNRMRWRGIQLRVQGAEAQLHVGTLRTRKRNLDESSR